MLAGYYKSGQESMARELMNFRGELPPILLINGY